MNVMNPEIDSAHLLRENPMAREIPVVRDIPAALRKKEEKKKRRKIDEN
jgi:hypothetical protein